MTDPHHPRRPRLAAEAPFARGAVVAALSAVPFGWLFVPQLLGMSLSLLSLARRERAGRRLAWLAVALSVGLTVAWGFVLGLLLRWWAARQLGG